MRRPSGHSPREDAQAQRYITRAQRKEDAGAAWAPAFLEEPTSASGSGPPLSEADPGSGRVQRGALTSARMLPSGSLNHAALLSPITCRSPWRVTLGMS